jgi:5-formyltetrahydrofolate cyclo-ligase
MSAKEALRNDIKHVLRGLSTEEINRKSQLLESQLLQYLATLENNFPLSVIGLYLPLRGEPRWETDRWAEFPWQLAYPSPKDEGMHFLLPTTKSLPSKGHWVGEGAECEPDVIVIPGLVFTKEGYRVGRGGGYYDRLLEAWKPKAGCVGVCFEEQLCEGFEPEAHDQKMNVIITDARVIECKG